MRYALCAMRALDNVTLYTQHFTLNTLHCVPLNPKETDAVTSQKKKNLLP